MSRMMIYINYPLSSQLTKFVTVTLTFVTVSYIVSYVRNQPESYTLTSLVQGGFRRSGRKDINLILESGNNSN
jgi:hypothetical protein